jgi:hypothetical protein
MGQRSPAHTVASPKLGNGSRAPDASAKQQGWREGDERPRVPSLIVNAGHIFQRGYERLRSAIFDPDGDCMRL